MSMVPSLLSVGPSAGSAESAHDTQNGQAELEEDALLDTDDVDPDENDADGVIDADTDG